MKCIDCADGVLLIDCADGVLLIRVLNFLNYLHLCSNALQNMAMPLTLSKKLKYETYSTKPNKHCLSLTQNLALTQAMTMDSLTYVSV
jgi:hypothetical protein